MGKAECHVWLYAVFPLEENSLFQTSPGIASTQLNPVHTCHAGDFQPQVCLSGIGFQRDRVQLEIVHAARRQDLHTAQLLFSCIDGLLTGRN